jgi:hypothetical protein
MMTGRWPWGAGPAPALRCDECGKRIGRRRLHFVTASAHLLCGSCLDKRQLHTKYYPDCPENWHDMYDHGGQLATRAAAWFVLNNPEKRTCA